MRKLTELLDKLYKILEAADSPLVLLLQEGISESYIDNALSTNGITLNLPPEVYDLYAWRNGIKGYGIEPSIEGDIRLFDGGAFFPIEFAIESYIYYALRNTYWKEGLFPLFETGGGEYYLMDCKEESETYRMIFYFSLANPYIQGVISQFDSLESLFTSIVECYEKSVYYYVTEPEKQLMVSVTGEQQIFQKNNPKSEYWRKFGTKEAGTDKAGND
jgi:hypothetical protein